MNTDEERERVKVRKRDGYEFCGEGRKIRGKNWKTKRKIESKGDRGRPSFFFYVTGFYHHQQQLKFGRIINSINVCELAHALNTPK